VAALAILIRTLTIAAIFCLPCLSSSSCCFTSVLHQVLTPGKFLN
jgi:hypothetical protein